MNTFGASDPNYMLGLSKAYSDEEEEYAYEYDVISTEKTEDSSDFEVVDDKIPITPIKSVENQTTMTLKSPYSIQIQQSSESFTTSTEEQALVFKSIDRSFSNIQQKLTAISEKEENSKSFSIPQKVEINLNEFDAANDSDSSDEEHDKTLEWEDIFLNIQRQKEYLFSFIDEQTRQNIVNKERIKRAKKAREYSITKLSNRHSLSRINQDDIQNSYLNNLHRRRSDPKGLIQKKNSNYFKRHSASNQSLNIISIHEESSSSDADTNYYSNNDKDQIIGLSNPNKTMTIDEL